MSTTEAANPLPAVEVAPGPEMVSRFRLWLRSISPQQGWDTYLLLLGMMATVSWSVLDADWVRAPGLMPMVVLSTATGLLLAQARWPWPVLHLAGVAVGFVVVIVLSSSLVNGAPPIEPVRELWNRLSSWYVEATSGGISTDVLPFTVTLLSMNWLLGYFSAWFLFRRSNVWVALVLGGVAILTNLSFLPENYESRFLVFMLLALLLVIRVGMFQREGQWLRTNIGTSSTNRWAAGAAAGTFSAVLLVVAAGLPLNVYVWSPAVDVWNVGRTPVAGLEGEFARLFSGIASRKDLSGRYFGKALPFQRRVSIKPEIVLWATSELPSYWATRTYSEYTPDGWLAGATKEIEVGPGSRRPPIQESANRDLVVQHLEVTVDTVNLVAGGQLDLISRDAVLETLEPMEFEIDFGDAAADDALPEGVRRLAARMREDRAANPARFGISAILAMLPDDLILTGPDPSGDSSTRSPIDKITVQRKAPATVDVVSWRFADTLEADGAYTMGTYISNATEADLRAAGSDYSGFIEDHYLQLPPELPQRVRDLAAELTRDAPTPVEKALAIQEYLRGDTFGYSKKVDELPTDQDAVDFFLFDAKTGYSDFFASAMSVMLRSAGVPARLAAGYGPGETDDETGRKAVRSSDSHGWTQVYFPGHGWIDFEPTPRWPTPRLVAFEEAVLLGELELEPGETFIPDVPIECYFPENFDSLLHYQDFCGGDFDLTGLSGDDPLGSGGFNLVGLVLPAVLAVASAVSLLVLLVWLGWSRGLSRVLPAEKVYTRMSRLGTLAGVPRLSHQTPLEYAAALGSVVPSSMAGASVIAHSFAVSRYGGRGSAEEDSAEVSAAWRIVRGGLLSRAFRRLMRLGRG